MGLAIAIALALAVLLALWRLGGIGRVGVQLVAAALFVALAGYAWQGRPNLPGARPLRATAQQPDETEFSRTREALLGRFDQASLWLTLADSYARRGQTQNAVGILRSGIRAHPRDADLWTGLGNALVAHADGLLTPAAELAFRRAREFAPGHPGPPYYYGMALAENGRFAEAEALWQKIVEDAPPDAEYRQLVAERLELLRSLRAAMEQAADQSGQ